MFLGPAKLKESQVADVQIRDISAEVFQVLLDYSYTFKMNHEINPDTIVEAFIATDKFLIEGLRHQCELFLCHLISKENACFLFQLAETYRSLFIKEECFDIIVTYFKALSSSPEFLSLDKELQEEITHYLDRKENTKEKSKQSVDTIVSFLS